MAARVQDMAFVQPVQDLFVNYVNAANEVVALNVDLFFDVALKNFNVTSNLRNSADALLADALRGQQGLVNDVVQVAQSYAAKLPAALTPIVK